MKDYVLRLKNISVSDTEEVGVKNAFLGEMFTHPELQEIRVPDGFAITASAYKRFIEYNKLDGVHDKLLATLDRKNLFNVNKIGLKARSLILGARMPGDIDDAIIAAYRDLCSNSAIEVAVRSSEISFAKTHKSSKDVHETFLNIKGERKLIETVKKCFASLFSDLALIEKDLMNQSIAVCVQIMVSSEKSCSGVAYTSDPETGFADVIHISGIWGIHEKKLQESVVPDEYIIYKPSIAAGIKSIIQKKLGSKNYMIVHQVDSGIHTVDTPLKMRDQFILIDDELLSIANWGIMLENYYNSPVSMEWIKDGKSEDLYLLQAKPEIFKKLK
jgi:pyruvate,water dikinase